MRFAHFFVDRPIFATVLSVAACCSSAASPIRRCRSRNIRRSRRRPSWCGPPIRAPTPRPSPPRSRRRWSSRSTASRTCSTCPPTPPATAPCRSPSRSSLGTDLDKAQVLVQNRVAIATPRLPEEVRRLGVTTLKSSPDLMMVVHMLSPDETYDQLYVSNYARNNVRDVLLRLDGVGDLIIFGERQYSLRIWLDPEKLAAFGMTSGDVVRPSRSRTCRSRAARSGQQPAPSDNAFQFMVTTQGRFEDPRQFRQIIVRATPQRAARPAAGRRPRRARRAGLRHQLLSQRQAGGGAGDLPAARHQRAARRGQIIQTMEELKAQLPARARLRDRLQSDRVHRRRA